MKVAIKDIVIDEELYPRSDVDKGLVESYRLNIDELPPIVLSKDLILIDGQHRLLAHQVNGLKEIEADIRPTTDRLAIFREAISLNARHGKQFTIDEKKKLAVRLAQLKEPEDEIAKELAVSRSFVYKWTEKIREQENAERDNTILSMYLRGQTQQEIAQVLEVADTTVGRTLNSILQNSIDGKMQNDFKLLLYDVWNLKTNDDRYGFKDYPGRIPGQIVENLIYRYTKPFDMVVDPMAGSGTTVDVCKAMLRRYLCYDLHPISDEIQEWDLRNGYPEKCKSCELIFLDPPYYKKKTKEYEEKDARTVSALSKEEYLAFFEKLAVDSYATLKKGGYLAFLMSNYIDYENNGGSIFAYHYANLFERGGFKPVIEIQCPLSTEQYTGFNVNQAKILNKILVISRSLFVFQKE